jgi:glyoxalase family protein
VLSDTAGVHHVSVIAGDPRANRRFYTDVLGLRFVLRTVNFEDQFTYHLYYGDRQGSPGTVLTSFPYPREVPGRDGKPGIASVTLRVPTDTLEAWRERLDAHEVTHETVDRFGDAAVAFTDPDDTRIELVGVDAATADTVDVSAPADGPVPPAEAVRGIDGVAVRSTSPYATAALLQTFGFEQVAESENRVRYRLPGGRESAVDLLTDDAPYGREGRGSIHHVALSAANEAELHEWRDLLAERDYDVSRVKNRHVFHSLYVRDPGGILFELATERPGLGVAEREPDPAGELWLPDSLEPDREMIESQLPPLDDEDPAEK